MKKNLELNNKVLESILVNDKDKSVTVVSTDIQAMSVNAINKVVEMMGGPKLDELPTRKVVMSNAVGDDEFDPYVGVALALAYTVFGSKTQFHKFVNEASMVKRVKPKCQKKLEKEVKKAVKKAKEDTSK